MYIKLTLQEKLKDERTNRHMTLAELEKATGVARATLGKYESDKCTDVSAFYLAKLAEYYGLSMDYLMGLTENKNHPNTPMYELHLNDSMIDLLKSGALNNRLLCEFVCHPGFLRLLTDMEVCIDRIADMRVHDMNLVMEKARQSVMEQRQTPENDLYMRTLELGQVSEELFFSHVIHDDLDRIVKDLRTRHESDKTTAEPETPAADFARNIPVILLDALMHKGTADEKRAFTICRVFGIDYMGLSEEERATLARVFKKSPLLPAASSQRGKSKLLSLFGKKKPKQ